MTLKNIYSAVDGKRGITGTCRGSVQKFYTNRKDDDSDDNDDYDHYYKGK